MADWQLAGDNDPIVGMAAVVSYSGELPELALSRLLRRMESTAASNGFSEIGQVHAVAVGPSGPAAPRRVGLQFNSSMRPRGFRDLQQDFGEQLQVDVSTLLYRTSSYRGWSATSELIKSVFEPALEVASNSIGINALRLEYNNRFYTDSMIPAVDWLIDRNCDLVSRHIFTTRNSWHCHTGMATDNSRITQVSLNGNMRLPTSMGLRPFWSIEAVLAREDRIPFASSEGIYSPDQVMDIFSKMHSDIKSQLADLFTLEAQKLMGVR